MPPCPCFNPRYQHAEASQIGNPTPEASIVSLQPSRGNGSKGSAKNAAGSQATPLQQLLHRQYAEKRRRQNMEKLGPSQTAQARVKKAESTGKSQAPDLPENEKEKEKVVKLGRRRRLQRPNSSVSVPSLKATSRNVAFPISKTPKKAASGITSHQQVIPTEEPGPPSANPLLKVHADVQELKKALEKSDKKRRASQIRLSTLKAPQGQVKNVARKVLTESNTRQRSPPRLASKGVGKVKNQLLSGTALTESALADKVKTSRRETTITRKPGQTPVRIPRRTGSGHNAVIEMINAKALQLSGNVPCIMALIQNLIITAVEVDQPPVPSLSFGLERVLFKSVSIPSLA